MLNLTKPGAKKLAVIVHDLAMTALAILFVFAVRFDGAQFDERMRDLPSFLPFFVAYAGVVYWFFQLYRSKWRFASLPDLSNIVRAVSILALTLLVVDYVLVAPNLYGYFYFGKIAIALYWLVQAALLGGPRLAYRYFKYSRSTQHAAREATLPALLLGRSADVEVVIRAMETGTMGRMRPVGILTPRKDDLGQSIRGVPVLGLVSQIETIATDAAERGEPFRRIVAAPSALLPEAEPDQWLARTRKLAIPISRLDTLGEGMRGSELAPLEIEDLLVRPSVTIDRARLEGFLKGKRVIVTGGGGSIGSEICLRCAAFGAAELLVVESSEPALFHVTEALAAQELPMRVTGALADVRDEARIGPLFKAFAPDIVIHAAALKHVPYLEADWGEGIKTNIFGSVTVTEAAIAAGAGIFVMISTDKAIEPVSMLGATKRFAEMIAQVMDARSSGTRYVTVRFGNVLDSAGSVVPLFREQIRRGGPVTVTDPEVTRYFMTIPEACQLILQAAAIGAQQAVYTLDMGEPVSIRMLAEQMIRLAGKQPGKDIAIEYTGLRPGEKLHESLFHAEERYSATVHPKILQALPRGVSADRIEPALQALRESVVGYDLERLESSLRAAVPEFNPLDNVDDERESTTIVPFPARRARQQ